MPPDAAPAQRAERWIEATWSAVHPAARGVARLVYDDARDATYLIGGQALGPLPYADAWRWQNGVWAPMGVTPAGHRKNFGMAYDRARERVVIYGGISGGLAATPVYLSDTWELDGTSFTQLAEGPPARSGHAMVYDDAHHVVLVFGGTDGERAFDDLYAFDGRAWSPIEVTQRPPARINTQMVFDEHAQRVLLFGGETLGGEALDDLWSWDGGAWTELHPEGEPPAPRGFFAMAYDRRRAVTVVYGGSPTYPPFIDATNTLGDMWEYDGARWTSVPSVEPGPLSGTSMTYDRGRDQLVMFGGVLDGQAMSDRTWIYAACAEGDSVCDGDRALACAGGQWVAGDDCAASGRVCHASFDAAPHAVCDAPSACLRHVGGSAVARYDDALPLRYHLLSMDGGTGAIELLAVQHAPGLHAPTALPDPRSGDTSIVVTAISAGTLYAAVAGTLRPLVVGTRPDDPYEVRLEGVELHEARITAGALSFVDGGRVICADAIDVAAVVTPFFCQDVAEAPAVGTSTCIDLAGRAFAVRCDPGTIRGSSGDLGALHVLESCAAGASCTITGGVPACVAP